MARGDAVPGAWWIQTPRSAPPTYQCAECGTTFTGHRGEIEKRCECRAQVIAAFREAYERGRLADLLDLSRATGGALKEHEIRCGPAGCVSCMGMLAFPCPFVDVDPGDVVIDLRDDALAGQPSTAKETRPGARDRGVQ